MSDSERITEHSLLTYPLGGENVLARCTEAQRRSGLYSGMPQGHARALFPQGKLLTFNPERSRQLLLRLTRWASSFSPLIDSDLPTPWEATTYTLDDRFDGFCIDLTGSEKLFSGIPAILQNLRHALHSFGFSPRLVLAPTRGCGWAVSRYTKKIQVIIEPQDVYATLSSLPVVALRIDQATREALREVEINSIQELLSIAPHSLRQRFGNNLLTRLQQALGHQEEPLPALHQTPPLQVSRFSESAIIDVPIILRALQELIQDFSALLISHGVVTRCFTLIIERQGLPAYEKKILLSTASADASHLWQLLRPHLEGVSYGNGMTECCYRAVNTEAARPTPLSIQPQRELLTESPDKLLDTLLQTLGKQAIRSVKHTPSHIPEESYHYVAPSAAIVANATASPPLHPRPSVLFHRPQPIQAIAALPDNPPYWLKWDDKPYRIASGVGPERIEPEWWKEEKENRDARDYYKVQLHSGAWLWIFREQRSLQWFIHGVWA